MFGCLSHFKPGLCEQVGKVCILKVCFEMIKLGMDISDVVMIFSVLDSFGVNSPGGDVTEGLEEAMEGRGWPNENVFEPAR